MSILSKDREVADGGRSRTLKDVKASLRDQLVKRLFDKLKDDEITSKLTKAWHVSSSQWAEALQRQQLYLQEIDVHAPADADSDAPSAGSSSNLHLPVAFTAVKTYHARFMEALLGVDPPFSMKARREDGTDRLQVAEDLMRYAVLSWMNRNRGFEEQADSWVWNWIATGTGILKSRWIAEYERFTDVVEELEDDIPQVVNTPDGQQVLEKRKKVVEKEKTVTVCTFEGPMLEMINLEDFRMVGGGGDPDLADIVFHRSWWTSSQLWTQVDREVFDEDGVQAVLDRGRDYPGSNPYAAIKQQRAADAGKASDTSEADTDRYEILEAVFKYDVDGSGISTDVVVWCDTRGALLGATYLRRIIKSGSRPYSVAHFYKRPDQEYGTGLVEIIYPLTKELDAIHNIRIDTGLFTNMPFFFYKPSVGMDAEQIQLEPGVGYPLNNPQTDVYFPQMSNKTAFTSQEEGNIQTYIERLTGVSDLSLGVMSGSQGASRTAAGVKALLGESNTNLSVHLRRLNRAWKKSLNLTYELMQERLKPDFSFRIANSDGDNIFRTIPGGGYYLPEIDFELTGNSANSNKQVQIDTAQQIMQLTLNPLLIQLQVSGPAQIYESTKAYVQALGVKDVNRYFKKPAGTTYVLEPQDEFFRVMRGVDVPVAPEADHKAFIAFANEMVDRQQETQTLTSDQVQAIIGQIKKHEAIQEALDQQQQQQAVQTQMQYNASLSQNTPGQFNPLQGSSPGQVMS